MGSRLRILIISPPFMDGCGGLPPSLLFLARSLKDYGVDSDVVDCFGLIPFAQDLKKLPDRLGKTQYISPDFSEYDSIVYAGQWHSITRVVSALYNKKRDAKFIIAPKGGLGFAEFTRLRDLKKLLFYPFVGLPVLLFADILVFSSGLEKKSNIFPKILRKHSEVIPDLFCVGGVGSASRFDRRESKLSNKVRIRFLAEISPRKGLLEAINGIVWLKNFRPEIIGAISLEIGGAARKGSERYLEDIKELVKKNDLSSVVSFVGSISQEEKASFYFSTDVFLASSKFESFGLTVLEALENDCLVIANIDIGVLEYIPMSQRVLRLRSLSPESIGSAILSAVELIRSPNERSVIDKGFIGRMNSSAIKKWMGLLC